MKQSLMKLAIGLAGSVATASMLVLCFPLFQSEWLAWIALVPLLLVLCVFRSIHGLCLSYLSGVIFFAGVFIWAFEIPHYQLAHHIMLALFLGWYFGIFGGVFGFLNRKLGSLPALCLAPGIWMVLEYVRSNLSFLSLPWPLLGHSQYEHLAIIQYASIGGAYSVSFLAVLVNAAVCGLVMSFVNQERFGGDKSGIFSVNRKSALVFASITLIILVAVYGHGLNALSGKLPEETVRIAVVQGNIGTAMKARPRDFSDAIMTKYRELTEKAVQDQPDIIVWPEAATPGFVLKNMVLRKQVIDIVKKSDAHFVIGSSEYPKFSKGDSGDTFEIEKFGNTALYFSPEGRLLGQYLKMRLIPFGEYIPYQHQFPWPEFIVPDDEGTYEIPGTEFKLFDYKGHKFGVIICWESHYPSLFRRFVKDGAQLMVNVTNEGWFGDSAAPYQKLVTTVFRAVENRVAVARAANTGVSCFIDPYGRTTGRVKADGRDIFVDGYLTQELPFSSQKTIYTRYGDWFVILNAVVTMVAMVVAFLRGKGLGRYQ